ncbi:MAG TPA: pyruvate dehydrogenase complex dihydrolipoamide acetyltransferase [Longimicrobiales bacterium]|nr:pyruvate dehydrogenase complex dihydrolipoamide acetyltransferase [Longimicrobiales bacterium]
MATKVHMEALSPTMEEGQIVQWLKNEGDAITEGDVIAEIETDKATMELVARGSGVLRKQLLQAGATAPVGSVIGVIAAEDEDIGALVGGGEGGAQGDGGAPAKAEAPEDPEDEGAEDEGEEGAGGEAEAPEGRGRPQRAAGASADAVAKTTTAPPEAEAAAARAKPPAPAKPSGAPAKPSGAPARPEPAAGGNGAERVKASPLARRLAADAGLDLSGVSGSGPGGRIVKRDVEEAAARPAAAGAAAPAAGGRGAAPAFAPVEAGPEVEEIRVSQMRKAIAKRLVESIGPVPTFYLTIEVDMTRMMSMRESMNERLAESGVKVSVNDLIIKATASALRRHPEVNAAWGGDVIRRYRRVHIGVAVAVEEGLITPIVRDADAKGVAEIATEVRELAGRAREKKLQPDEYTGATFSISNLGMFGIDEFTAIINPPEAAILAVGRVEEKPVLVGGRFVPQPRMRLTMSCDHRVVDGAMGATFLQTLRAFLEEPMMMLA